MEERRHCFGRVILDGKAGSTANENQIDYIRAVGPLAHGTLDLENIVRHYFGDRLVPVVCPRSCEDIVQGTDDLVRGGILRRSIRDHQNGSLQLLARHFVEIRSQQRQPGGEQQEEAGTAGSRFSGFRPLTVLSAFLDDDNA